MLSNPGVGGANDLLELLEPEIRESLESSRRILDEAAWLRASAGRHDTPLDECERSLHAGYPPAMRGRASPQYTDPRGLMEPVSFTGRVKVRGQDCRRFSSSATRPCTSRNAGSSFLGGTLIRASMNVR